MIEGSKYIEIVQLYFKFLVIEFGFIVSERILNGNFFYDVSYTNKTKTISISYENAEDYLQVIVFLLQDGKLPDYDDKTKTKHLNQLNSQILPLIGSDEIKLNNEHFSHFEASGKIEKDLLKAAKELRLCLLHLEKSK